MSVDLVIHVDTSQVESAGPRAAASVGTVETAADSATVALKRTAAAGTVAGDQVATGAKHGAQSLADLVESLGGAEEAAKKFGDAADGAAGLTGRQLAILERIRGPLREHRDELDALNELQQRGELSVQEYEAELIKLEQRYGSVERAESILAQSLEREATLLQQIRGPLVEYEQNLAALEKLQADGKITAAEYTTKLDELTRKAGVLQGPLSQVAERDAAAVERINGPMQRYQEEIATLKRVLDQGRISTEQYDAEVDKLNKRLGINQPQGPISQLAEREAAAIQRIRGPMQQYEQEVQTLERLMNQGRITAAEYESELEKQAKKAGVWQGPVQQQQQGKEPAAPGNYAQEAAQGAIGAAAGQLGPAGQLVAGIGAGAAASAAAVVGLGVAVARLSDEYIVLSNAAQKLTAAGGSVEQTLQTQYDLSLKLHAGLSETMSLYDAVRDGTDELNLSQGQQLKLTQEIGDAVIASGHSVADAEGLMKRLTFAFASGSISGRELKSVMKEFPDIGAAFVETMGHSRKELIDMANKGQISADMLIAAFDKMGKEMEGKVGKKVETLGQQWDHFKDKLTVGLGNLGISTAVGKSISAFEGLADAIADADIAMHPLTQAKIAFNAAQSKVARGYLAEMEALKQLSGEEERNAKTGQLAASARKLGIDFGNFDEAEANKQAKIRIEQRAAGVEIADAFADAHGKATLFGAKLAEINERREADKIAEDVKRLDLELNGVNEAMDKNFKKWTDLNDQIELTRKVVERFKLDTPAGVPIMQDQREAERRLRDLQTQRDLGEFGGGVIQDVTKKAQAKDALEDYTRALQKRAITQQQFRTEYDKTMTEMNDGRLPEAIKIFESIHDPIAQSARDFAALNSLLRSGKIDTLDYRDQLEKIVKTGNSGDAAILTGEFGQIDEALSRGTITLRAYNDEIRRLVAGWMAGSQSIGGVKVSIGYESNKSTAHDIAAANAAAQDAASKSVLGSFAQLQEAQHGITDAGTPAAEALARLRRSLDLGDQFVKPLVDYERTLKEIADAQNYLKPEQTIALQRKARDEYHAATEALEATKGPLGVYQAGIRKLGDQFADGDINIERYRQETDKLRASFLQASGEAQTFRGGMGVAWLKLKQEADGFGATVAGLVVSDVDKLNQAIVTAANGGEVAWGQMVDSMIQDLERLLIKQLEVMAITALLNAALPGSGTAATASGVTGSAVNLANGFGAGDAGGSSDVSARSLPGAYPALPSASPTVSTATSGLTMAPTVNVHNHVDESVVNHALTTRSGQRAIANVIRRQKGMRG